MSSKMLIDSSHREETRVVVTKGNRLEDFDFESEHKSQVRGNIYLAKVTRVEPSLQAAFVDYGGNRHGFLAFSEIHPDYYQIPQADRQALLDEEAALVSADFDDEASDDNGGGKSGKSRDKRGRGKGRNRRGRGRDKDRASKSAGIIPDAEPVAMDAYIAAWEAAQQEAADTDDDGGDKAKTVAASADDGANTVSEALDDVFGTAAQDDSADDSADAEAELAASDDDDADEAPDTVETDDAMEESRPRRRAPRRNYKIQEVIKRRQIILVQVVKEERGNKGAALTTYLSLAGRYSVLMPNTARGGGISRKITNLSDRGRLKDIVKELEVPKGMGVILRTAGADRSKSEIHRDYDYLMRMWDSVRDLTLRSTAPTLVYEEGSLIKRSIRDLYNQDISEIVVAGAEAYREAKDFMRMLMPSHAAIVQPWRDAQPIFARTGIETELDRLVHPQVTLKSGGYIIINQTEALVAIDVNSGKSTKEMSVEDTALATNLEAAEEVARQLRLRDLAGLIVVDFIDMEENRNNRAVEKKLKECLKADRARIQVGRISHFGLLEMSRQRMRASVLESTMTICPHCEGTGYVRSVQSVSLHLLRAVEDQLQRNARNDVIVKTSANAALYVLNNKRETLVDLERRFGVSIQIEADHELGSELYVIAKGDVSTRQADPDAVQPISADFFDDPEQVKADQEAFAAYQAENGSGDDGDDAGDDERGRGRKRRRRRRGKRDDDQAETLDATADAESDSDEADDDEADGRRGGRKGKRRSRGRRGGRNRRGRRNFLPDAEPVGPLADLVAREAEDAKAAREAEKAQEEVAAEAQTPVDDTGIEVPEAPAVEANTPADSEIAPSEAPAPEASESEAEITIAAESAATAEEAPADEAAPQTNGVDHAEDEEPVRKRATASTINLDVKPVVSSSTTDADAKPKRGWWSRK